MIIGPRYVSAVSAFSSQETVFSSLSGSLVRRRPFKPFNRCAFPLRKQPFKQFNRFAPFKPFKPMNTKATGEWTFKPSAPDGG